MRALTAIAVIGGTRAEREIRSIQYPQYNGDDVRNDDTTPDTLMAAALAMELKTGYR